MVEKVRPKVGLPLAVKVELLRGLRADRGAVFFAFKF
jgi:hypothetical protein